AASSRSRFAEQYPPIELAAAAEQPADAPPANTPSEPVAPSAPALATQPRPDRTDAGAQPTTADWFAFFGPIPEPPAAEKSFAFVPEPKLQEVDAAQAANEEPASAGTCGTAIDFVSNLEEATARARKEHKLLFVLHVSGNFEESGFT